jgi:hypothetical protein
LGLGRPGAGAVIGAGAAGGPVGAGPACGLLGVGAAGGGPVGVGAGRAGLDWEGLAGVRAGTGAAGVMAGAGIMPTMIPYYGSSAYYDPYSAYSDGLYGYPVSGVAVW